MKLRRSIFRAVLLVLLSCSDHVAYAGFAAGASASGAVRELRNGTYVDIQPWTFISRSGSDISGGPFNTSAVAINGPHPLVNGMTTSSSAEADLATGTLRGYSTVSNSTVNHANAFALVASGFASLSDSFHIYGANNAPFIWSDSSEVVFRFHLDGSVSGSSTALGSANYNFFINVYPFGTIGHFTNSVSVLGEASWSDNGRFDELEQFGSSGPIQVSVSAVGRLSAGGYDLEARFNPRGDFDWSAGLWSLVFMNGGTGAFSSDFNHTVTMAYSGPAGSVTSSSSGVFPGTLAQVPAPGSAALILVGLVFLVRRKS